MGLTVHFEVLNQLGTPMMYSATLANRPAAGITGRIFFRTDSPFGIFRDNGSSWDQIGSAGGGNTIYTGDDTLTSNRTVSSGGFTLTFRPQTTFLSSLIPAVNASSYALLGSNTLTYAVGFSSNNIGNVYSANGAINSQIFDGNATFAQANLASAMVNVNSIDFSSGGHTVTMTQSTGIRAMSAVQNQIQFQGSHNGTISHAAISQNLGFYRPPSSTRTLTITNAYSQLINALDDYGAGFTFTNRWATYQAGANDINYFASTVLFGTTVNAGYRVDIAGTARVQTSLIAAGALAAGVGSVAFCQDATTGGSQYAAAIGYNARATNSHAMAIGYNSQASANSSYAFGFNARAIAQYATAFTQSQASGSYSVAFGNGTNSIADHSFATGQRSYGYLPGQMTVSSNNMSYVGDSQASIVTFPINTGIVSSGGTYSFTGIRPLNASFSSGVSQIWRVNVSIVFAVKGKTNTLTEFNLNDTFTIVYQLAVKSNNGTGTSIIGSPVLINNISDTNMITTSVTFSIVSNNLVANVTPPTWVTGQAEFRGTIRYDITELGNYGQTIP